MGWYILQVIVFCLGAASSALWYEPGGRVSVQDATIAAGGIAVGLTWAVTAGISWLRDWGKRSSASAGAERIGGRRDTLIE